MEAAFAGGDTSFFTRCCGLSFLQYIGRRRGEERGHFMARKQFSGCGEGKEREEEEEEAAFPSFSRKKDAAAFSSSSSLSYFWRPRSMSG